MASNLRHYMREVLVLPADLRRREILLTFELFFMRRYPGFYGPLVEVALRLFAAEPSSRPDAREALGLVRGLAGGEAV